MERQEDGCVQHDLCESEPVAAARVARRAPGGPSEAEPGADVGPGAAQRRRLI